MIDKTGLTSYRMSKRDWVELVVLSLVVGLAFGWAV